MSELLAEHGPMLLLGGSALLALGALLTAVSREPLHKQRVAEATLLVVLAWLVLAVTPLPRPLVGWQRPASREWASIAAVPAADSATGVARVSPVTLPPVTLPPVTLPPGTLARVPDRSRASTPGVRRAETVEPPLPPAQAAAPRGGVRWELLVVLGAVVAVAHLLLGQLALHHVLRRSAAPPDWLSAIAEPLLRRWLGRPVRLRVVASCCRPFCTGLRRPTIALPASLCRPQEVDRLRHVLLHEIAHLRQRDGLGRLLFALALPVAWFHPLYWWLRRGARLAAEQVADDWAARRSDRRVYARALIELSERYVRRSSLPLGALSVLRTKSEFYRRMNMLLTTDHRLRTGCTARRRFVHLATSCLVLAVAVALAGVPPLAAQEPISREPVTSQEPALQRERDALRAEVKKLRAEVQALKGSLAGRPHARVAGAGPAAEQAAPAERTPATRQVYADSHYVIDLVTRAIELDGQIDIARRELQVAEQQAGAGVGASSAVEIGAIKLKTLQRKHEAVRAMVTAERQATEVEFAALHDRYASAEKLVAQKMVAASELPPLRQAIVRAEARLKLLASAQ